jgi:hypothetical protein
VADFTLTATGGVSGNNISGTSPVDSGATLKADTWTLTETPDAAATGKYTASDWVCVGGTQNNNQITVGVAGEATCTITNNDIPPKLHLRKVVTNDNGGTATVADFTLTATGGVSGNNLSGTSPVDSGTGLQADTWTLTETPDAAATGKYNASAWVCVGGTQSTNHITVGVGGEATCTITNDDIPPQLHLRKVVTNDNGGTATVADFTLTATGGVSGNNISGTSPVDSGATLQADTWTLSETPDAAATGKYTASDWVCVGGSQGDATHITVDVGGSATCTITNNDIPPKLHLRKVVTNDNGGTATVADFTLTATGTVSGNNLSGTSPVDSGTGLKADTWTLTETLDAAATGKYTASSWVCVGGTQSTNHITVDVGGEATCTITNNDIPPALHLRKVVVTNNGGTATVADFTLTATGTLSGNNLSGTSPVDSGTGLQADTWTLTETLDAATTGKYSASSWVCVGGTQSTNHITVGVGGSATCTITNDDIPGHVTVSKTVSGGPLGSQSFTFQLRTGASATLAGTPLETHTVDATHNPVAFTTDLSAGTTYNMCELVPAPGWKATFSVSGTVFGLYNPADDPGYVCVNFTVNLAQTVTISVDNTPPPGGNAATIGYWKNHSSCSKSNGNQAPVLDQTLAKAGTITLGKLTLTGTDCVKAFNILNKTTIDGKTKVASDPLSNMAAQLLGADLNIVAGAATCTALTDPVTGVIAQAQALLLKYSWNGNGPPYTPALSSADAALANSLNTKLDAYNNNNFC